MRAMKDSGIEWIGEIPKEWKTASFKRINRGLNTGEAIDKAFWSENSQDIPFYTAGLEPIYTTYQDFPTTKYTRENDILLARNGTPYVYMPVIHACYTDHIIKAELIDNVDKRFIQYGLQQSINSVVGDTVSIPTWSASLWNEQIIPMPNLEEQTRIADYLDKKCAEIDALIAAKEKTNALLKERRQSIIYEAVTKGLDPTAPMKDSGIEWIGEIPEGWDVVALKRLGIPSTGSTPSKDHPEYWDGNIPWLSSKDLKTDYLTDSEDHITEEAIEKCGLNLLNENTLIFCVRSGILRHTFPVTIAKMPTTINQDLRALMLSDNTYPDYVLYYLKGMNDTIVTLYQKIGATVESIEMEWFNYLPVVLPSLEEQKAIAQYLAETCDSIDIVIMANENIIDELKEYRQSVIYEAVTGKVEV